jgi:hypothetical protein
MESNVILACYEVWLTNTDDGWLEAVLIAVEEDGQQSLVATHAWPPPIAHSTVSSWLRSHMDLTKTGVLVLR